MGSGLSMSSVNKIKELANSKEYSLALDIIDSQDLSKSLNPQFLRLCGDVYIKTGRYIDAREILLMAHKIAPEAKRVMYSLVDLYLRVGYFDLAKTYYDIYMFDADEYNEETVQLKYIYDKANKVDSNVLEEYLYPRYVQSQDYDWSFELYLLYKVMGKDEDAESLAREYAATFKNIDNLNRIADIEDNKLDINELFYVYASEQESDDNPEQEELRLVEQKLLEADELRIHPKEAEITIMVDDNEEAEIGSKRKLKKFLKEQEKIEKKKAKEEAQKADEDSTSEDSDSTTENISDKNESTSEEVSETADDESSKENLYFDNVLEGNNASSSDSQDEVKLEDESVEESQKTKMGFFKKVFQKKRKDSDVEFENEGESSLSDNSKSEEELVSEDEIEEISGAENSVTSNNDLVEEVVEISKDNDDKQSDEESKDNESDSEEEPEDRYNKELFELTDATTEEDLNNVDEENQVTTDFSYDTDKDNNKSNLNSVIFVDYDDDDFEAEAETIDGLKETFVTPPKAKEEVVFEEAIFAEDEEDEFEVDDFSSDDDSEFGVMAQEDYDDSTEDDYEFKLDEDESEEIEESEYQIEEAELAENDDEFDVDDFSAEPEDEFGKMSESYEDESHEEESYAEEAEIETETYEEVEKEETAVEEEVFVEEAYVEEETYVEGTVEEESYVEESSVEESSVEETYEDESREEESYVEESYAEEAEIETETYEEVEEEETAVEEEVFVEEETYVEETVEEESYEDESSVEETYEDESHEEESYVEESYAEEAEIETETYEEVEEEVFVEEETYVEETVEEESYEDESSVEETYEDESHEEESYVEVTYAKEHEIETKEYEKQEEQIEEIPKFEIPKKKIDFPVFKSSLFPNYNKEITTVENNFNEIMTEAKDKIQENNKKEEQMLKEAEALLASLGIDLGSVAPTTTSYAQINETLYEGPSRDELKASLKIDSVKKNILNKLKEYR